MDDGGRVMLAMPYSFESDLDTELEACEANDIIGLMSNNYVSGPHLLPWHYLVD